MSGYKRLCEVEEMQIGRKRLATAECEVFIMHCRCYNKAQRRVLHYTTMALLRNYRIALIALTNQVERQALGKC